MKYDAKQPQAGAAVPGAEILAALAHDLRSPMCSVIGAAQLAKLEAAQGRSVDRQLNQILLAIGTMDRMLTQMCGAIRGAEGQEEANAFSPDALERDLRALIEPRAEAKRQHLSMDFSALNGCALSLNGGALGRVLLNLLSNAVKYTPEGGEIALRTMLVEPAALGGRSREAVFIVSDNGMGMKPEFLRRLYQPFARAQESAHLPGAGLGLAIVRRLVREMDGAIDVRSEWGRGTVFTVRVPAGTPAGRSS